jgi:acyl carrier protein
MLLDGHSLHVFPEEVRGDGKRILALAAEWRIQLLDTSPALLTLLVDAGLVSDPGHCVEIISTGGEAVTPELWKNLANQDRIAVWNLYGPTECTVMASGTRFDADLPRASLGRPLANMQVYLTDSRLRPTATGMPGELCIGGLGLGQGYVRRPAMTAAAFVPDPFGPVPGARLYRTGDLVKRQYDDALIWLRRIDQQIKLRGFRVEPGEIESQLRGYPGIKDAAVVVHRVGPEKLVAFLVPETEMPAAETLTRYLGERLPAYMVPRAFAALESLPLSRRDKLDREALSTTPLPDTDRPVSGRAPRTPTEELLAGIWRDLLGLETVVAEDQFFDLGGHSLLATRLVSRVRNAFGIELPLRAVFEHPMLADQAEVIERQLGARSEVAIRPLRRVEARATHPLSFAQQRLWFIDQLEPGNPAYNIPTAERLRGPLGIRALEEALAHLGDRHASLKTRFPLLEGQAVQEVIDHATPDVLVIDLSALPVPDRDRSMRELAALEASYRFDLSSAPPARFTLLRLENRDHLLLLTLHHIITDGWSMGILQRDLIALYRTCSAGGTPPPRSSEIRYVDYAVWQHDLMTGERHDHQMAYWRARLGENPPVLDLPTDFPRPRAQSAPGAVVSARLTPELAEELIAFTREHTVTHFMMMLAV